MGLFSKIFRKRETDSAKEIKYKTLKTIYNLMSQNAVYPMILGDKRYLITGGTSVILSLKKQYADIDEYYDTEREHGYMIGNATYYMTRDQVKYVIEDYSNFIDVIVSKYEELREKIRKCDSPESISKIEIPSEPSWWTRGYTPTIKK